MHRGGRRRSGVASAALASAGMTVQFFRAEDPDRPRGPRWRTAAGAVVVLLLVLAGSAVAATALSAGRGSGEVVEVGDVGASGDAADGGGDASSSRSPESRGTPGRGGTVFVHVLGQVVVPGLYEVAADARLVDVVAAAGGFTPEADQGGVNLARTLTDGEQVRVPAMGEVVAPPPGGAGGAAGGGAAGGGASGAGGAGSPGGLVPLGTATAEQLETLPGVGPATSAAILTWRDENGGFRSVDDLLEVPGIGEKTLEKLRPLVTP